MATWDYICTIVPSGSMHLLASPGDSRPADLDRLGLWKGWTTAGVLAHIPEEYPRSAGWTEALTLVRFDDGCRMELFESEGELVDVRIVLDLREPAGSGLAAAVRLAERAGWRLVDRDLRPVSVRDDSMNQSIRSSAAYRFVVDPHGFLDRLSQQRSREPD